LILCEEGIDIDFIQEVLKPIAKYLVGYENVDFYKNKSKFEKEYKSRWIDN